MSLKEWSINFIKAKDAIKQQLQSVDDKGHTIHALYKDGKLQEFFSYDSLGDLKDVLAAAKKADENPKFSVYVVCYNSERNLKTLIHHWKECALHQRLSFYFVNPDSQTEIKWVVNPWLHNRVSDDKKLESGLKSLSSMVEEWKG